jgi:nicotinamide-nucleotide adenylyltransferase
MIAGEDWEQFVPEAVTEVIEEIDGVRRLRNVSGSDQTF